jgi:hypothetical protein
MPISPEIAITGLYRRSFFKNPEAPAEKKAHLHQKDSGLQSFDKAAIITGE